MPERAGAARRTSPCVEWLRRRRGDLRRHYDRLFVPRNDGRWLQRNALVAAGNVGGELERAAVETYCNSDDDMLREQAEWALARHRGAT